MENVKVMYFFTIDLAEGSAIHYNQICYNYCDFTLLSFFNYLFVQDVFFLKKSDKTALHVFWNGVLRIFNCHNCCRRWYFTFNGEECSAPAAIDGVVYMINGNKNEASKNLLRVRQIEGACEKIQSGVVRVGFWVGNCKGFGSADAKTGWQSVSRIYVEEVPPPQA